jgi:hypothetical protein
MNPATVVAAAGRFGWLFGGRRRRRVERLAASRGLTVLARRSLFPQTSGFELTLALPDDPDTVAVLRAEDGTDAAAALAEATRLARVHGDELRSLLAAFGDVPVVGLYPHRDNPWVAARLTKDSAAALGRSVRTWAAGRAFGDPVSLHVVAPGAVPAPDPELPALFELMTRRRAIALRAAASHRIAYRTDGTVAAVHASSAPLEPVDLAD